LPRKFSFFPQQKNPFEVIAPYLRDAYIFFFIIAPYLRDAYIFLIYIKLSDLQTGENISTATFIFKNPPSKMENLYFGRYILKPILISSNGRISI
jgi:hypothetical protein